jgi:hypothetical protein
MAKASPTLLELLMTFPSTWSDLSSDFTPEGHQIGMLCNDRIKHRDANGPFEPYQEAGGLNRPRLKPELRTPERLQQFEQHQYRQSRSKRNHQVSGVQRAESEQCRRW